mmetsp:Transcript_26303/g.64121  ORF Transcript_26303/g.64121 Transcript_26303/m.64121 type:complete len:221 (-) Transcript_26303:232-894(-)
MVLTVPRGSSKITRLRLLVALPSPRKKQRELASWNVAGLTLMVVRILSKMQLLQFVVPAQRLHWAWTRSTSLLAVLVAINSFQMTPPWYKVNSDSETAVHGPSPCMPPACPSLSLWKWLGLLCEMVVIAMWSSLLLRLPAWAWIITMSIQLVCLVTVQLLSCCNPRRMDLQPFTASPWKPTGRGQSFAKSRVAEHTVLSHTRNSNHKCAVLQWTERRPFH